jgi:hypothetical protein
MAVTDRALPFAERLLDDRELQRDLRELATAVRGGFQRAEKKEKQPSRLLGDRKFKQNAQQAKMSFIDAAARLRGEPPKPRRGRKLLVVLLVVGVGAAAFAAREVLKDQPAGSPAA